MTTEPEYQDRFWVTCELIIDCGTIELLAADESEAYQRAQNFVDENPWMVNLPQGVRVTFKAEYAPVEE